MDTGAPAPRDGWHPIPWTRVQRTGCTRQKRLYRASRRGEGRAVRTRQRLRRRSRSARLLAVRRVTQEHHGTKTAGVEGVKALAPPQRLARVDTLSRGQQAKPVRRVWSPQPATPAPRPLGLPVIADRALQALATAAREPAGEARFEPNSDGCRPGRSCQEALDARFTALGHQAQEAFDADRAQGFDRIKQAALLTKVHTSPSVRRPVQAWLKAGVRDHGQCFPPEAGTRPGGKSSPLVANSAGHGLETSIVQTLPRRGSSGVNPPNVRR
jgi:RNA-directed DNA polymerase